MDSPEAHFACFLPFGTKVFSDKIFSELVKDKICVEIVVTEKSMTLVRIRIGVCTKMKYSLKIRKKTKLTKIE